MEENKEKIKKKRTLFHKIVNVFLYFFLFIFVILVIVFGATQTSTFREFLRTTAMKQANANLNGTVYIEKIEGTIFSSLILRKTVINMGKDTILNAGKIEVRTSPLQLLFKKIKVRKAEISDATIALISDSSGKLNISNLLPPSKKDTTKSSFPFTIQVNNFSLVNVDFYMQRYDKVGSKTFYDLFNITDLRVKNINLSLNAFADIDNKDFHIDLEHLSLNPNINNFKLKRLSGNFIVNTKEMLANNIILETQNSLVKLGVSSKGYNLFDSTADFTKSRIELKAKSDKFNFADVSPFVKSLNMVKGDLAFNFYTEGTLKELNLKTAEISFLKTHLYAEGVVRNLDVPDQMYIKTEFKDTYLNMADLQSLLPSMKIPVYEQYGLIKFDTLQFYGKPKNFQTKVAVRTDKGSLYAFAGLNFEKEIMAYDLNLTASSLDISPFTSIPSVINLKGSVKGSGTKPEQMNATIDINGAGSVIKGMRLDTLKLIADAGNKIITFRLNTSADTMGADLQGKADFSGGQDPVYNIAAEIRALDLSRFSSSDSAVKSDLNLSLTAEGSSFDLDKMNLYTSLMVRNSTVNGIFIDSTRAIADIRRAEGEDGRVINFISDVADITVTGKFNISQMTKILSDEASLIVKVSREKTDEVIGVTKPVVVLPTKTLTKVAKVKEISEVFDSTANMKYLVEFKNFALLSMFMGGAQIELDGEMSGNVKNTSDSIYVNYNSNIRYIKYRAPDNVFFLSNLDLNLDLQNNHKSDKLEDIKANLTVTTDRIFTGGDIKDVDLKLNLHNKVADLSFSAWMENSSAKLRGSIDLRNNGVKLLLDTLKVNYKNFDLVNNQRIDIEYLADEVKVNNFSLSRNNAIIGMKGNWSRKGNSNLNLFVKNLRGKDLSTSVMGLRPENALEAVINVDAGFKGYMSDPAFGLNFTIDSVTYKNQNFGKWTGVFDYKQKNMTVDVTFKDSMFNPVDAALKIAGNIPMNIDLQNGGEMFSKDKPINIRLLANDFNLGAFGDIFPAVNKLGGRLVADMQVTGTPDNLSPKGFMNVINGSFIAEANNMEFKTELRAVVDNENLKIDTLIIMNTPGTENGGAMIGSGTAVMKNFAIVSSDFNIKGDLKVLSEASKGSSASVYGDLVIATDGNLEFKMNQDGTYLKAPIIVKSAKLTIPPTQSAYQNSSQNFIYKYVTDTTLGRKTNMDFESLVNYSKGSAKKNQSLQKKSGGFDYSIDLKLQDEATIIFVLSRELNQNLTAVLKGNLSYESIDGRPNTQGELTLLEGSTLEFIKTLSAEGTIKFDNDISNPNLNITATYKGYYYPADSSSSSNVNEVEVAVKIKVKGPLKDLNKNFMKEENNIAVYYGADNIANNVPDQTKSQTDAIMFMAVGKFASESTQQDKSAASGQLSGTATSLAGSLIGGFLNNQLGDYVKSVELRRVGSSTKFNLSGRVKKFRYSIGGTTDVFQDLSQANIRIEYPFTNNLLLRLERRQSITETTSSNEMINELGLKYKFEF